MHGPWTIRFACGDRIPPLERSGQPLEQEHGFSSVLSNSSDASADFNGRLTPSAACRLDGNRKEDVRDRQTDRQRAVLLSSSYMHGARMPAAQSRRFWHSLRQTDGPGSLTHAGYV